MPQTVAATPKFDIIGDFNLLGGFDRISLVAAVLLVFTLLLADFFDTMGTMTAIGNQAGLVDRDGNVEGANRILLIDSIAAAAGGAGSVSSNTSYTNAFIRLLSLKGTFFIFGATFIVFQNLPSLLYYRLS